jgi:hypothetical protein
LLRTVTRKLSGVFYYVFEPLQIKLRFLPLIGMIMMIVSVATNRFATKNQRKISAFNGHIIISNYDNNQSSCLSSYFEKQDFYPKM